MQSKRILGNVTSEHLNNTPSTVALAILFISLPVVVLLFADFPIILFFALSMLTWVGLQNTGQIWKNLFAWAALLGTLGEMLCVLLPWTANGLGLWKYEFGNTGFLDKEIPLWLPLVWGDLHLLYTGLVSKTGVFFSNSNDKNSIASNIQNTTFSQHAPSQTSECIYVSNGTFLQFHFSETKLFAKKKGFDFSSSRP